GTNITIWVKSKSVGSGFKSFVYYTTDGSNPEGGGGTGIGTTSTAALLYDHTANGGGTGDWWKAVFSKPVGTLKYKISMYKGDVAASVFPADAGTVDKKKK